MNIKVFGKTGTRIMTANTLNDIRKIANCFERWEYIHE